MLCCRSWKDSNELCVRAANILSIFVGLNLLHRKTRSVAEALGATPDLLPSISCLLPRFSPAAERF
jgi:hypothetical protein